MRILIDGYNLLRYAEHLRVISKAEFVTCIARYARLKNHLIHIIFDGGDSPWPIAQTMGAVTVVYSGWNQSADSYIQEFVARKEIMIQLLVSSDIDLGVSIMQRGIPVIDTPSFWNMLSVALEHSNGKKKQASRLVTKKPKERWTEIDFAMQEALSGVMANKDSDRIESDISGFGKKSRLERILEEIIKKL